MSPRGAGDDGQLGGVGWRAQDVLFLPRGCGLGVKILRFWHFEPCWVCQAGCTVRVSTAGGNTRHRTKPQQTPSPPGCVLPLGLRKGTHVPSQRRRPEGRLRPLFIPPGINGAAAGGDLRPSSPLKGVFLVFFLFSFPRTKCPRTLRLQALRPSQIPDSGWIQP